jgi:hypothetical protein
MCCPTWICKFLTISLSNIIDITQQNISPGLPEIRPSSQVLKEYFFGMKTSLIQHIMQIIYQNHYLAAFSSMCNNTVKQREHSMH